MKNLSFLFLLLFVLSSFSVAQNNFPLSSNNAFTLHDSSAYTYLKKFNMSPPFNLVSVPAGSTQYKQSIEFGAPGYLYCIYMPQSYNFMLGRIDTSSGVLTQISSSAFILTGNINYGLSWDKTNNKMYTIFNNPSRLYTVNLSTGVFTIVDTISPSDHITSFAVNNSGSMFGFSTLGNKFLKINKTTGVETQIGTITLTAANICGCDFDPLTGIFYILYPNGSNTDVYKVDTVTAGTTLVGTISSSVQWLAITGNTFVGINQIGTEIPSEFSLNQNYPNPFNPGTKISFSIAKSEFINIAVYDMLGRVVTELVNEKMSPGDYNVGWNSTGLPGGVYFYKMTSKSFTCVKKMVLVK